MKTCEWCCQNTATKEVQTGWNNAENRGCYASVCSECYDTDTTDEAATHRREHLAILRYVRDGRFVYDEELCRWLGPHGMSFDDISHRRLIEEISKTDPATLDSAVHPMAWFET